MHISRIVVTWGGKINLGNYESANVETTIEASLEPGDDATTAQEELWQRARAAVQQQAAVIFEGRERRINAVFQALPPKVQNDLEF